MNKNFGLSKNFSKSTYPNAVKVIKTLYKIVNEPNYLTYTILF